MKIKLTTKDFPTESPESWDKVVLRLYLKADKNVVDKVTRAVKEALEGGEEPVDDGTCPDCGAPLRAKWSGIVCTKCDYWFCY